MSVVLRFFDHPHLPTLSSLTLFHSDIPDTFSLAIYSSFALTDVPEVAAAWSFTACRSRLKALSSAP